MQAEGRVYFSVKDLSWKGVKVVPSAVTSLVWRGVSNPPGVMVGDSVLRLVRQELLA